MQVRAVYDFDAQESSNELSLRAGDILNVTRQDVGDGWWEGVNRAGQRGLFPETYVEVLINESVDVVGPPSAPPPPLPDHLSRLAMAPAPSFGQRQSSLASGGVDAKRRDSWGDGVGAAPQSVVAPVAGAERQASSAGDFDDDWSDDDESLAGAEYNHHHTVINSGVDLTQVARNKDARAGTGTVKKSMNRFSPFVKSGTESYLLNSVKLLSKPSEVIELEWTKDGPQWPSAQPYTCNISSHQKASKMHGLKSFIAYQLTPSINNLQVSRRYKHFDWLFDRLQEKYTIILIPPLPEKQVTGRYEDDFVEHRMQLLQLWLNKICRHPVLSQSDVWMHFLTCTDEKEWKRGKRKAEKDEYSGGLLFYTIKMPPGQSIDQSEADQKIDSFYRCCRLFEDSVRNFHNVASDNAKRMIGPFRREFCKMGGAFRSLASSFEHDHICRFLALALQKTGDCYEAIGKAYEEQPKTDCVPLLNELFIYKGMLGSVPDVLQVHKSACSKYRESQKLAEEGRITGQELDSIRERVDTISCATLAEINHFQQERSLEFNVAIKRYLNEQIHFYQGVVDRLKEAASKFQS